MPNRQWQLYPGPLRPTNQTKAIYSTLCAGVVHDVIRGDVPCPNRTINGEVFCYRCKDPDGYTDRLQQAQQAKHQRCLEAYPVCARCGSALTQAQVASGQTRHPSGYGYFGCYLPGKDEPLAQRGPGGGAT